MDAAFGVNGRIGYRLHPRIAVEGEFEWIDGFDGYITEHVVITFDAQYVMPFGDVDDLDYTSIGVGVQYRF